MKKQINSLTIKPNNDPPEAAARQRLALLAPGCLLLAGFWGLLWQELSLDMPWLALLAVPALLAGLLLRWDRKWQALTLSGALVLAVIGGFLFREGLTASVAALLERLEYWRFLRTGVYSPGYEAAGSMTAAVCLGALFSGFAAAWLLRAKIPVGLVESGWWLALWLLGVLLILAGYASGRGKALILASGVALGLSVILTAVILLTDFAPQKSALGTALSKGLHALCWETAENPLPEGQLTDLGPYQPTDEAALEVTMEHWTPLYLRGFVAGNYTDSGWEQTGTEELAANAESLYALQQEYFLAADQIFAAWESVEEPCENSISIQALGACRATVYLPYGAGNVTENTRNAADLRSEGLSHASDAAYSAQLYPIESCYLLQAALKDTAQTSYRSAEAAYRDWVYDQYLDVPESAYQALTRHFAVDGTLTTVQAKQEITALLAELIEYRESTLTSTGERDFLSYVLEVGRQGYSVHYATLATFLLRCCGIPARYVEGYVVSSSQAASLSDGETLTLTQYNAHAWTEYYLDGVGWLPFDATPGYTDILHYELPLEGQPTQESGAGIVHQEQPEQEQPEKTPNVEQEKTQLSQRIYVRAAIHILLILVILALILAVLRTVLLRKRLGKKLEQIRTGDPKRACAGALCYLRVLTDSIGMAGGDPAVSELAQQMSTALDGAVEAESLAALLNEVWYSTHDITPQQQEAANRWLDTAAEIWKRKVPGARRFCQRYITCKIY